MSDKSDRPLVLYHGGCTDGFCAAYCLWLRFREKADYLPAFHGTEPPLEEMRGRQVFMVDFAYKRPAMERVLGVASWFWVLDHHKTAATELAGMEAANLYLHIEQGKSGGRLAWEFYNGDRPAPWLVRYTEARDLWTFHLPFSKEISAAIASYPFDFHVWDQLEKALSNDRTDLRGMRGEVPESAADFKRRTAQEVLLSEM